MLLPWILVFLVLGAALIGLVFTARKRLREFREHHHEI